VTERYAVVQNLIDVISSRRGTASIRNRQHPFYYRSRVVVHLRSRVVVYLIKAPPFKRVLLVSRIDGLIFFEERALSNLSVYLQII
jgi:hypothetical protein